MHWIKNHACGGHHYPFLIFLDERQGMLRCSQILCWSSSVVLCSGWWRGVVSWLPPHVPPEVLKRIGFEDESWLVPAHTIPLIWNISDFATTIRALESCPCSWSDWVCFISSNFWIPNFVFFKERSFEVQNLQSNFAARCLHVFVDWTCLLCISSVQSLPNSKCFSWYILGWLWISGVLGQYLRPV